MTLPNLQLSLSKQKDIKNTSTSTASVINNIQLGTIDISKKDDLITQDNILKPSSSTAVRP